MKKVVLLVMAYSLVRKNELSIIKYLVTEESSSGVTCEKEVVQILGENDRIYITRFMRTQIPEPYH